MQAEILMIGTELLLGQIQDTNATYLAQVLKENGINLFQKTTVGDNKARIMAALDGALSRSGVVLCSGGLGPTEDDITRECIAELLGRPLEFREDLYNSVLARFSGLRMKITENNKKQATLPAGAIAIENPHGTAPGVLIEDPRGIIFCMPGVPFELKPMMEEHVVPYLRQKFGLPGVLHYRVLKVCGMGESRIDDAIGDIINAHTNPSIGLLASPDVVRIRIAARAENVDAANAMIAPVAAAIEERLAGKIFGHDDDTLEGVVDQLLQKKGWRLAISETSTGGKLCQRLVAAGSKAFAGGQVYPAGALPEGLSAAEQALDLSNRCMLGFPTECGLGLAFAPGENRTVAVFQTPESTFEWEIGAFGTGERSQLRTSVTALEMVRRSLLGMSVSAQ